MLEIFWKGRPWRIRLSMSAQLPLITVIIGAIMALFGSGGLFVTFLNYRRDGTTAIIAQHSAVLDDMRNLYEAMKGERDEFHREVVALRQEVSQLKKALQRYKHGSNGQRADDEL